MNYQEAVELAKANPDDEEFRVYSVTIRPLLQDEPQSNEYFETVPEAEAYFDTSVAWDPGEEYVIEVVEWSVDAESGGLNRVGVLKSRSEIVAV